MSNPRSNAQRGRERVRRQWLWVIDRAGQGDAPGRLMLSSYTEARARLAEEIACDTSGWELIYRGPGHWVLGK